jgi:hypothetical protein
LRKCSMGERSCVLLGVSLSVPSEGLRQAKKRRSERSIAHQVFDAGSKWSPHPYIPGRKSGARTQDILAVRRWSGKSVIARDLNGLRKMEEKLTFRELDPFACMKDPRRKSFENPSPKWFVLGTGRDASACVAITSFEHAETPALDSAGFSQLGEIAIVSAPRLMGSHCGKAAGTIFPRDR